MSVKEILDSGADITINMKLADLEEVVHMMWGKFEDQRSEFEAQKAHDRELLSKRQVADILNTTPQSLWRWHKAGYLKHVKVGVKVMYHRGDVERILNEQLKEKETHYGKDY